MTEQQVPPAYLGRYSTIRPGGQKGSRKIVIPAKAPDVNQYDVYMEPSGTLILIPARPVEIAPVQIAEG